MHQCRADVEIQRVAELIFLRSLIRFDPCREVRRFVTAETAAPERAEQMPQQSESKKVDRLVRQLEPRRARRILLDTLSVLIERRGAGLLLRLNPSFFDHAGG